ncbi:6-phosphofructo-2-kinase/fructose-2,6-bisphosphatase [Chondromyces crocatus]|uniref:Fructose-2,6-bisphosphate 2-phosphatase n=1 Tax=Chondromyces crocatus TaxID=52 RepID=A0A0K1E964_CHOCO|nr:6-phosphofructo-2-kinase/fructose-2,6-bisphosphatase [Chondromyces crocatus]AKT37217.1 fructose-2,6-bisphosphate 2-phosphatase [Chondromyces crocatus]
MHSLHPRDLSPHVLAMVGLPARGKTSIARKITRYLSWLGHPTRVFNVGSYRRSLLGAHHPANFFAPENREARRTLDEMAMAALDDLLAWLGGGGEVAIFDATNSTRARRQIISERCRNQGYPVVFIESICGDEAIIETNVRETKLRSPDYEGVDAREAVRDFRARIAHYTRAYEPVTDLESSYIKIIDVGRQVMLNRIHGYVPARLVPLLMNMHVAPRPIWLTRHGESLFNQQGLLGGDPDLSPRGEVYARSLAAFVRGRARELGEASGIPGEPAWIPDDVVVWTSSLRRTIQTSRPLTQRSTAWRALDEIDAGVCEGMTYEEIQLKMPQVFEARAADKFRYRYPRGESYEDVIQRLDPMIIELERQRSPVLVIAHQAVLRALYAYLMDKPPHTCPSLPIPLHTVIELVPTAYGCEERRFQLAPEIPGGDESTIAHP